MDTSNRCLFLPSLCPFWQGPVNVLEFVSIPKPIYLLHQTQKVYPEFMNPSVTSGLQKKYPASCPAVAEILKVCINRLITSIWNWASASCSHWVWLSLEHWKKLCCGRPLVWQIPLWKHWQTVTTACWLPSDLCFLFSSLPQYLSSS